MPTAPPTPTTGFGFTLGVRPFGSANGVAYTPLAWLTSLTPPKISTDGADTTLLSGTIMTDAPTVPKYEFSGSMQIVEGDAGYEALLSASKQAPIQFLSWKITHPNGATKTCDGWISSFDPSQLTLKEVRTVDFTVSVTTVPIYTAPPPTT